MRISIALILVLGLAACEAEPPIVEPSPWIYEDDRDAVEPTLDGQEVAEAIEAAMAAMATIEPLPAYLRYEEIAQMGDAACPTRFDVYEDGQDTDYWIAECQADSGATFSGFAYRVEYDDAVADDMTLNGFVLQFSGRVDGPDGEFAQGSGALADVVGASDTYVYYQRVVDGSFAVDADAAAWWRSTAPGCGGSAAACPASTRRCRPSTSPTWRWGRRPSAAAPWSPRARSRAGTPTATGTT
jgi:hypothetical protein